MYTVYVYTMLLYFQFTKTNGETNWLIRINHVLQFCHIETRT